MIKSNFMSIVSIILKHHYHSSFVYFSSLFLLNQVVKFQEFMIIKGVIFYQLKFKVGNPIIKAFTITTIIMLNLIVITISNQVFVILKQINHPFKEDI